MPRFIITCNAKGVLNKVVKQLTTELGVPEADVDVRHAEHKIIVTGGAQLGSDVLPAVRLSERVLVEVATLAPPERCFEELGILTDIVSKVDFAEALSVWEGIHHRKVASWSLETRLRKKSGSTAALHTGSKSAMQVAIREGLRTCLTDAFNAALDFKTPDIMVQASLSETAITVGIPILNKRTDTAAVAKRVAKGLHHSVAWGVARTAALRPGELVADLCVGKGGLLLEAAQWWPESVYIGSDISEEQITAARGNVDLTPYGSRMGLVQASAKASPFRAGTIDVVISDLPFGRMWNSPEDNEVFYPRLLREVARVLCAGGRAVLLTGEESEGHLAAAIGDTPGLETVGRIPFRFGGNKHTLMCELFCVVKGDGGGGGAEGAAMEGGARAPRHAATADDTADTAGIKRPAAAPEEAGERRVCRDGADGAAAPHPARALFDWRYAEKLQSNATHSWRNEKPTMVPYRAKAFVGIPIKRKQKKGGAAAEESGADAPAAAAAGAPEAEAQATD